MLTIGGFSRLGNVSRRMLRHYDSIGLLKPSYTAPNGYRYYDGAQLAVLEQIKALCGYGFKLSEIGGLLKLPPDRLAQRIHERLLVSHRQLDKLRKTLRAMEEDIAKMKGNGFIMEKYHIIVMNRPRKTCFA
jgi:DNA-binding transcriptional MerR regulator